MNNIIKDIIINAYLRPKINTWNLVTCKHETIKTLNHDDSIIIQSGRITTAYINNKDLFNKSAIGYFKWFVK